MPRALCQVRHNRPRKDRYRPDQQCLQGARAMLMLSPIRSPSLSSTTSPRWMPTRNWMRRSGGRLALRSIMPFCISIAQRTASTTLLNSMRTPSPVRFDDAAVMHGDGGIDQIARSAEAAQVSGSSSDPASWPNSDHIRRKKAASFRVSAMAVPSPHARLA